MSATIALLNAIVFIAVLLLIVQIATFLLVLDITLWRKGTTGRSSDGSTYSSSSDQDGPLEPVLRGLRIARVPGHNFAPPFAREDSFDEMVLVFSPFIFIEAQITASTLMASLWTKGPSISSGNVIFIRTLGGVRPVTTTLDRGAPQFSRPSKGASDPSITHHRNSGRSSMELYEFLT
ncbi:hypothetical protein K504DRAFT_455604 [Pleomassaria siparia CBS 279.74]|uniref:Uncharacterized protein n=1 Tax=Pleomassaria siparia CBS 279.74 TaxID=1314801 RepID=A0A6G1K848_9PLEO|nr:hypothetical protein K504DRAFT_455604 [Pleomassaria siparia CBS 279.74]